MATIAAEVTVRQSEGESLLDQVLVYQHPMLMRCLQQKLELASAEAEELFRDTKRFLYECYLSKEPLSPTARVDEGWHNFILFTHDYAEFCEQFFGRFIHHVPLEIGASNCKQCSSGPGDYCKGCSHGQCSG